MMRMPRLFACAVMACCLTVPLFSSSWTYAQASVDTPKEVASGDKSELFNHADAFWHYAKIARYDLAAQEGQQVLAKKDQPQAVLEAMEQVSRNRKDNLDQWLLRWQGVPEMKDVATQLIQVIRQGYEARRADPAFIEAAIKRLPVSEQAYSLAVSKLRQSGELAVGPMIDALRDPNQLEAHAAIRRALQDMGKLAVNPLLAATEMNDTPTLASIATVLGNSGYEDAVPYLSRLVNDPKTAPEVKGAAVAALVRMGQSPAANTASLFLAGAEKYYYRAPDNRSPVAYVWYWDGQKGLTKKEVPAAIFNDLMAMRDCEYALKLDQGRAEAVSLWLAANYKREADLPQGQTDPTRAEGQPDAHYYGVAAGTQYLNTVLARALKDHNGPVALRAIRSLQQIVGQSNLFDAKQTAILDALRYPDRQIRFEAAFALAAALPQKAFPGQERVVPTLAEAMAQSGKPNVLVLAPQDQLNGLLQGLKDAGYGSAGGVNSEAALAAAATLPTVDVVVAMGDQAAQIDALRMAMNGNPRLESAALVIVSANPSSSWTVQAANNPLLSVTKATDAAGLKPVIDEARTKAGSLPMDEKIAADYAMRAADLLGKLAISRGQVLDLAVAQTTLLGSLDDSRPEVVKAVGRVVGLLNSKEAQAALLIKAADAKTPDEVKASLYKSVATSARFFGNMLDQSQIDLLQKAVAEEKDAAARSAAAEAHGALNLPADQAKSLIVSQSKV